jgi:hypothetical protein
MENPLDAMRQADFLLREGYSTNFHFRIAIFTYTGRMIDGILNQQQWLVQAVAYSFSFKKFVFRRHNASI